MSNIRFKYQTKEFGLTTDIHIRTLRDKQQFFDKDDIAKKLGISSATWPLFGVIWPSSEVLANLMYDYDIKDKKILEVGCGIGLSSLLLNHKKANITATDYHPEVQAYLLENTKLNNDSEIPFVRTSWEDDYNKQLGKFDLIIGSDLLYESNHITLLSKFINSHAKDKCEVIIVDPGRKMQSKFGKIMETYGFTSSAHIPDTHYLDEPYKGKIFKYIR
ncbi:MAG: class I SAM-dependent methyltransferase [Campylobacterota bacterium]